MFPLYLQCLIFAILIQVPSYGEFKMGQNHKIKNTLLPMLSTLVAIIKHSPLHWECNKFTERSLTWRSGRNLVILNQPRNNLLAPPCLGVLPLLKLGTYEICTQMSSTKMQNFTGWCKNNDPIWFSCNFITIAIVFFFSFSIVPVLLCSVFI